MRKTKLLGILMHVFLLAPFCVKAGEIGDLDYAQVVEVRATEQGGSLWRFDVTVRHNDEGWDHYAEVWQVTDPSDGSLLGERVLAHPHVHEQPVTRSKDGIEIPQGVTEVLVRAACNVHGFGGREITVDLTRERGKGYVVNRERQ
jgi:hypothetical protein